MLIMYLSTPWALGVDFIHIRISSRFFIGGGGGGRSNVVLVGLRGARSIPGIFQRGKVVNCCIIIENTKDY